MAKKKEKRKNDKIDIDDFHYISELHEKNANVKVP